MCTVSAGLPRHSTPALTRARTHAQHARTHAHMHEYSKTKSGRETRGHQPLKTGRVGWPSCRLTSKKTSEPARGSERGGGECSARRRSGGRRPRTLLVGLGHHLGRGLSRKPGVELGVVAPALVLECVGSKQLLASVLWGAGGAGAWAGRPAACVCACVRECLRAPGHLLKVERKEAGLGAEATERSVLAQRRMHLRVEGGGGGGWGAVCTPWRACQTAATPNQPVQQQQQQPSVRASLG